MPYYIENFIYNMEKLNLPINTFVFTAYLKLGGLETKNNYLREAW